MRENLEGKEVDVFAVINGFSQEGQGSFYGSLAKLSEFCGIKSKTTTAAVLKSLVEKGAILKDEEFVKGVKVCSYRVNKNWYGISKIDMGGIPKIDTNNKDIKVNSNRDIKGFTPPTIDEVRAFCSARGNSIDAEEFVAHYTSNGWMVGKAKMKDWKSAVITWEKSRKREQSSRPAPQRKKSVLENNIEVFDALFGTNEHARIFGQREEDYDEQ